MARKITNKKIIDIADKWYEKGQKHMKLAQDNAIASMRADLSSSRFEELKTAHLKHFATARLMYNVARKLYAYAELFK